PLVDELRVRRGDVELDEVAQRLEAADDLHVVLRGLAGGGDDQRNPVRQVAEGRAGRGEAGGLEPVAVDASWSVGGVEAWEVGRRVARARPWRDALRGDGAEAEPHETAQETRVVVHRGEDQRVRQRDAAERDGEPRIRVSEDREAIERQEPEPPLPERDRAIFGETDEHAPVERAIEAIDGADHGRGSSEDTRRDEGAQEIPARGYAGWIAVLRFAP